MRGRLIEDLLMILGQHHAVITRLEVFDPFNGSKRRMLLSGEDHLIVRVDGVVQVDLRWVLDIAVTHLHRLLLAIAQGHLVIDVRGCDDAITHQRLIVIKRALLLDRLE